MAESREGALTTYDHLSSTDRYLVCLHRIEGQVWKFQRMVSEGEYCIDILTQMSAIQSVPHAVTLGLLEDYTNHCVINAAKEFDEVGYEKIQKATYTIARLVKSWSTPGERVDLHPRIVSQHSPCAPLLPVGVKRPLVALRFISEFHSSFA